MAETGKIAAIANRISQELFSVFHWKIHPQQEVNFDCVHTTHKSAAGKQKKTHPEDVIYHYFDPYLGKRIYLHTDLKSYAKTSIQQQQIREALNSLAMTVECAAVSASWREKFLLEESEPYEVRGMLFVANHC